MNFHDDLSKALGGDVDTDVLAASNPMLASLLDMHGRESIASSEHVFQSKARKLTSDASARASMFSRLAQSATSDAERAKYMEAAFTAANQLAGLRATMVEVSNLRAKGINHATVAKVISGPPEQREFISMLAAIPDNVLGQLGGLVPGKMSSSA